MHSHVGGSHHAKPGNDDFDSFRGIASEGHTRAHTHTQRLGFVYAYDFENKRKTRIRSLLAFAVKPPGEFLISECTRHAELGPRFALLPCETETATKGRRRWPS